MRMAATVSSPRYFRRAKPADRGESFEPYHTLETLIHVSQRLSKLSDWNILLS